ncbi:hypothetical protein AK88_03301 [Plasmodium fragile]|uniref:SDA1 N-terminal domain-containing protein n=1 Tax=Plasmodium fragile TaxID=5857 RepID=A0A0D9QJ12_PLAFR|nr:uncharacterized protein AK88_03301 [Plasmodium fragile]KJP87019.1 hypothetical protein AK88_03301 [Plasmodium fragile]
MEAKLKKKKYLNHLQQNICRNPQLYQHDFYEQFEQFLFNYGVVLLNPFKKNDLFCNQLSFLSYTVRFFCPDGGGAARRSSDGGAAGPDADPLSDPGHDHDNDEDLLCDSDNGERDGEEEEEDELHRMKLEEKRKEIWNTMKSKAEAEGGENAAKRRREEEKKRLKENPLLPYEDLNEYINLLMVADKAEINFAEELFFLTSQLLVKHKNNLYVSILLSILKTLRQMKRSIEVLRYLQVLIFLCDVNLSKVKMFLFKSVVETIVQVHRTPRRGSSTAGPKVAEEILHLLHEAYVENSQRKRIQKKYASSGSSGDPTRRPYLSNVPITESLNNFSCSVLIELIKKKIYVTKTNINFLCEGVFYKNEKIVKCICFCLLGKFENKEFVIRVTKEKINTNEQMGMLKSISNQTHQKLTKAKIKKLHQKKEKILSNMYKGSNPNNGLASSDEDGANGRGGSGGGRTDEHASSHHKTNYTFIDLLFDPHTFSNNIFNLICTKYKNNHGTVKLLLLNILCRLHHRNHIVEENLFLYYENVLDSLKSKMLLPKYLSAFIQCIHSTTPPMYVIRIVHVLVKKFLYDNTSEEFIYLIINTIIQIVTKCPAALDEEVFEAVLVFKDYKNKNTATLIRRFINLCKEVNPELLDRKFLDKKTALLMQRRKILSSVSGVPPDTASILQYSYLLRAGQRHHDGDSGGDEEEEEEEEEEDDDDDGGEHDEEGEDNDSGEDQEEEGRDQDDEEEEEGEESGVDVEEDTTPGEGATEEEASEEDELTAPNGDDCMGDDRMGNDRPDKQARKARRREAKVKKEQSILQTNAQILSQKILTDEDFRKLRRMRDYVVNNKQVVMADLQDICNADYSEDDSGSSADEGQERIITHEDLLLKKKIKKQDMMKMKIKKKSQSDNRFKTNKEKEKKKSVMMLTQKLRRKKQKNAIVQYGKMKKKLKGKLAARAKKRGILQKRIAKKLSRRRR